MKKIIVLIGFIFLLSGCSLPFVNNKKEGASVEKFSKCVLTSRYANRAEDIYIDIGEDCNILLNETECSQYCKISQDCQAGSPATHWALDREVSSPVLAVGSVKNINECWCRCEALRD
ncbi:MAG: membrane lipoprotein lipid attachment site-containing protein [Patescibacteria group bacterium]|jgi:hypothetical protein